MTQNSFDEAARLLTEAAATVEREAAATADPSRLMLAKIWAETYRDGAALLHEKALSGMGGGTERVIYAGLTEPLRSAAFGAHDALHCLWSKAVGGSTYSKAEWRVLDAAIGRLVDLARASREEGVA